MMDLIALLEMENATIRRLLGKLLDTSAGQPEERRDLFLEVAGRLHAEIRAEVNYLYPLLLEYPETRESVLRSRDESRETEELLTEMAGSDPDDPRFGRLVERLHGEASSHLAREESELFPRIREALPGEQLDRLGDQIADEIGRRHREFGRA